MATPINVPKLVQIIAEAYNVAELAGFLTDYFQIRLDHIINPVGVGLIEIARAVVDYFDRNHRMTEFVRELGKDRPGKIHIGSLLASPTTLPSPTAPSIPAPTIDINPDEIDFYFVIEPDLKTVPPPSFKQSTSSIYVRIPAVGASGSAGGGSRRALALALDRSGSMRGEKIETARAAAGYLLDLVAGADHQASIVAFDTLSDLVVPLQSISSSAPYKATLNSISPRGSTDLFSAWQRCVTELRTLDERWDRRVVLITDGQLNSGMVDPARFEQEVRTLWKKEKIATTCVSMGDDWNIDLLNKLSAAGGGSIHFMKDEHQAQQVLHEAFHTGQGVVAANLRAELEPLGSARITEIQGASTTLAAGTTTTHLIAGQLRTNVEECLVIRVEFTPPLAGQSVEVLRSRLLYDDPATAVACATPEKVLRIYGEAASGPAVQSIIHQGVVCSAHTTLSRHLFKESLGAFLHGDSQRGQTLLEQSRFALQTTHAPRGYQAAVSLQRRRIEDLEHFDGHVPIEYIKEKYIEEMSHRDVVWIKLCEILDRLLGWTQEHHVDGDGNDTDAVRGKFRWADSMVNELAGSLPVQGEFVRQFRQDVFERPDARDERPTEPNSGFWFEKASEWMVLLRREQAHERRQRSSPARYQHAIAVVAGACFGFERRRQGTRAELVELMEAYLVSRLQIPSTNRNRDSIP